jgi:hypothetical protein
MRMIDIGGNEAASGGFDRSVDRLNGLLRRGKVSTDQAEDVLWNANLCHCG